LSKLGFLLAASSFCWSACQPSTAITEPPGSLNIQLSAESVELGKAFTLTVVQVGQEGQAVASFDESSLPPLVLQLLDTDLHSEQGLVREQRVYRAFSFEQGLQIWPQYGLQIEVLGSLDADDPGVIELPGDVLPLPRSWARILVRAAAILLFSVVFLRYRSRRLRRQSAAHDPALVDAPQVHPADQSLQRLQILLENPCTNPAQVDAYFVEISRILRLHLVEQFAVPALEMTAEQLHAFAKKHQLLPLSERQRLDQTLGLCDQVKFAGFEGSAPYREQAMERACLFIIHCRGIDA
jgi:hypothetical protein